MSREGLGALIGGYVCVYRTKWPNFKGSVSQVWYSTMLRIEASRPVA